MSRPETSRDAERRDSIAGLLVVLGRSVESARRENAQGWTIQSDLAKMQDLLGRLEALDEKQRSA